jgi:D-alanine--poly(phosphoribitol) ligase subunit 1
MPDVLFAWLLKAGADPSRVAVKDGANELDHGALLARVESLVAGFEARDINPGDRVALQLPNSVDFVVAALASLWVGAIFVPIAVADPPLRVAAIVDDCEPALILTNANAQDPHPQAIQIDSLETSAVDVQPPVEPADLDAYIIYTSGTTGVPKGVVIGRRAFAAAVGAVVHNLGLGESTRTLCVSPVHFDGSFATIFPTLAVGGALVLPPRESLLFARVFFRTVDREAITYTGFSTSYLRLLLADPRRVSLSKSTLQVIALGGEACSAPDVEELWSFAPQIRVFNRYGPTETTIAVTHYEVTEEVITAGGPVPIGRPHDLVSFHLLDADDNEIGEVGQTGELYVGGSQLMNGYWRSPELTASVLRSDVVSGETVYRTGDLVSRDDSGSYVYVDRVDRVVKRNAVRISLIELGDALRRIDGVSAAVCVSFDNGGTLGIVGFVVTSSRRTSLDLRRAAGGWLPESMLPDRIDVVDQLPLTSSSKVDERRLLLDAGLRPA